MLPLLFFACSAPPAAVVAPDTATVAEAPSLYDLQVPLVDQDGRRIGLDVDRGHPVLAGMFFSSCRSACPVLIQRIEALRDRMPPGERAETRVLLVSLDPVHDDPAALSGVIRDHGLDDAWTLASPVDPAAVAEVAAVLDVKYRAMPSGGFGHTSAVVLLDGAGHPVARADGLDAAAEPLLDALHGLTPGS